jgi:hypothetical protein
MSGKEPEENQVNQLDKLRNGFINYKFRNFPIGACFLLSLTISLFCFTYFKELAATITLFNQGARLQVADVSLNDFHKVRMTDILDIKIHNTGSKSALLKKITFHINQIWELEEIPTHVSYATASSALTSTATYQTIFPADMKGAKAVDLDISHSIKSDESDRFLIDFDFEREAFDPVKIPQQKTYIYHAKASLFYEPDNREVKLQSDMIIVMGSVFSILPFSKEGDSLWHPVIPSKYSRGIPYEKMFEFEKEFSRLNLLYSNLTRLARLPEDLRIKQINLIASSISKKNQALAATLLSDSIKIYVSNKQAILDIAKLSKNPGKVQMSNRLSKYF